MSKYLELFKGSFNDSINEKTKPENKPYIGYSLTDGKIAYTVVPKESTSAYQMVDLGLPSGLKWADRNVGASSPEDAGLYFQWGDTVGYTADQVGVDKVFNWDSYNEVDVITSWEEDEDGYRYPTGFKKYNNNNGGLTVLESSDDAATVHMGSDYRMPTSAEIQELISGTTQTFIDLDGKEYDRQYVYDNKPIESGKLKGVRFTSSNGNSIFIPAAGDCCESLLREVGMYGELWSSSLSDSLDDYARTLYFNYDGAVREYGLSRYYGLSVRGVQEQHS